MTQTNALPTNDFLKRAAIGSMFEIQSSEIARKKSNNDEVRRFAERVVEDYSSIARRLRSAARDRHVPSNLDHQHEQRLEKLRNASEGNIDSAYVDSQLQAHREAVEIFDNYSESGDDAALKRIARDSLPELRDHLQTVQKIQGSLRRASRENGEEQSRIFVEQPAPSVHVEQASPRVAVHQAQPRVTVRQPQPEIHVRQQQPSVTVEMPQPTVTIEMPHPEITIRIPKPEVEVSMSQPQVEVSQQQPQVKVSQSQQPRIEIEKTQPHIKLELEEGSRPRVDVQRAETHQHVQYKQAEARVVVKQAEGQPRIRFEQSDEESGNLGGGGGAREHRQSRSSSRTEGREDQEDGEADAGRGQAVAASRLLHMSVYDAQGAKLGEVERVVKNESGQICVVVGAGGFLLGKRILAIPADIVILEGDRLVADSMTEEEIDSAPQFRTGERTFRDLSGSQEIWFGQGG